MKTLILIPSRLSATRLPGKPLLKIDGLSIISHVVRKAKEANIGEVIVAAEDQEIIDDVESNGGKAILTSNKHKTGTDRIYEALKKSKLQDIDLVMNLQGDEPLMNVEDIKSLNYISKKFENSLFKEKKLRNKNISLNKLHKHINKISLNNMRISLIKKINQDHKFSYNYYNIAKSTLDYLIGNEVAMQKNINVSIQTPRDKDSMLSMHSDIHAGESPFEVVAWLPLTDVDSNSMSMFITKPKFNRVINKAVTISKKNI